VNAINAYDTDYGRFPVSHDEQVAALTNDFTAGLVVGMAGAGIGTEPSGAGGNYSFDSNSNIVAILMDMTQFPNGTPVQANLNHAKNPRQVHYLNARLSGYNYQANDAQPLAGVDNTGVYRDPWGNPYKITMDLSYDDHCSDLLYSMQTVSQNPPLPGPYNQQGFNGLSNPNPPTPLAGPYGLDEYLYNGKVMVWSAGPDRKYRNDLPANTGENKDNILSWQ
jgi:hypothetical protein